MMCRSQFKEDGTSYEQVMVWPGAHDSPLQSPYCAHPMAIIAGKENKAMFKECASIMARELPRSSRCQVRSSNIDALTSL
jgi:hypothetical protein